MPAASLDGVPAAKSDQFTRVPALIANRQATFDTLSGAFARTYQEAV